MSEDEKMAEVLNQYLSTVFTREDITNIPRSRRRPVRHRWKTGPYSAAKIRQKMAKLKTASAPGPDGITARLLQEMSAEIASALEIIFRKSMTEGTVPEDWRVANVTPIFKKGAKANAGSYRPLFLTSVCSKLMETLIREQMTEHVDRNQLINPSQHGFMPKKSCVTNLLEFLEKVTKNTDEGIHTDLVYLDLCTGI